MEHNKIINCHDCVMEFEINDEYDDLNVENIKFCPCCGGSNIEVE